MEGGLRRDLWRGKNYKETFRGGGTTKRPLEGEGMRIDLGGRWNIKEKLTAAGSSMIQPAVRSTPTPSPSLSTRPANLSYELLDRA